MLYGVSIFKVAEYLMGQDGYPLTHEWTLYIFDALLMLPVMAVFYLRYPSKIIPAPADVENLQDVHTSAKGMSCVGSSDDIAVGRSHSIKQAQCLT